MKVESWIFIGGTPLFFAFGIVYGVVTDWNEWVGTSCLFLTGGLSVMIGAYLAYTARHIDARPEDNPYGEIAEGAGELGEFAPHSWWPLAVSAAAAVIFAGLAVGFWLVAMGVLMLGIGLVGWVYEFYRGEHAH
ncbi:cytochrome c oxidase subunit 4 [Kineosporia rhizophila]|uniref:cytochrome c oxidase subunit 4 n=1 Tax=Kineosporia TaxID=49184 RepID=UPI000B127863|nr:cytochrome c oxidase subunit 4 [Kineosporia sp. NBRC 101677]MCE0538290.1 cytochrome c oxidase subunit 4 [Kineosporia rhizophila]GLY18653.1 putative cytochrome c oxidase polypeptide 4 [Kineosporia sp. NBRC 101677]